MKISIMLTGTVDDWLELEKFLRNKKITYSSIMSQLYRNRLAIAWVTDQFQKGEFPNQSLPEVMENVDKLLEKSEGIKNQVDSIDIVLDGEISESEVLSLLDWYEKQKEGRERKYTIHLTGKLRRAIHKLLSMSYEEVAPFRVSIRGEDTFITLVWDILTSSELSQQDRKWLVSIAPKKGLTLEESLRFMKYSDKSKFLRSKHS
ncbi:MAG: hypothetical protein ABSF24_02955 [Candidatus Bathyarchaeia archaeon]|jgi:hypothetical protein